MNESPEPLGTDQEQWLGDELEQAYQRALDANNAVEWEIGLPDSEVNEQNPLDFLRPASPKDDHNSLPNPTTDSEQAASQSTTEQTERANSPVEMIDTNHNRSDGMTQIEDLDEAIGRPNVTTKQVVEAALFVGGTALTTKKLGALLGCNDALEAVERSIDELNSQYDNESRPYEIVFGEGGYRLILRPEYERLRNRVFGIGPKDVRLSQEVLQVLAMVAYKQPVTRQAIEEAGNLKVGNLLRQLLRRELIIIRRSENAGKTKEVSYTTTPRFLSVFGLGSIDELPQIDDLEFK